MKTPGSAEERWRWQAARRRAWWIFIDETSIFLTPLVRRTWAPSGTALCKTATCIYLRFLARRFPKPTFALAFSLGVRERLPASPFPSRRLQLHSAESTCRNNAERSS